MDSMIFNLPLIEWIGYLASLLVLISLTLASILRLRLVNLIGATLFSFYGFFIGSLPVGIMNFVIAIADIYYLRQLYSHREKFDILEVNSDDPYLKKFILHYQQDIEKFFPDFSKIGNSDIILLVLRDLNPAGAFVGVSKGDKQLNIKLDYVTPQYRDYKLGKYIYTKFSDFFKEKGYKTLTCRTEIKPHQKYLRKMGFSENPDKTSYSLQL
jgi:ribosomal protein S18 acetylase RimI-like enzyme